MSVLEAAIGWLAPPDCLVCGAEGDSLCQSCSASEIKPFGERCWRCNSLSPDSKTCPRCRPAGPLRHVWISTTYEASAQLLVQKYKFGHLRAAAPSLARIMSQTYLDSPKSPNSEYLIVSVPTATSRLRERGFDHSQLLAKLLAHKLRMPYANNLRRLGQTRQLGSKRQDRLVQLADSFAIKNRRLIVGRDILLVDDVLTTGGTLVATAKCLKLAGANQVNALVFAKRL